MIVDPDMPDHWKVQMLGGLLGDDPVAPIYLIRLWGHCQNRKKFRFNNLPAIALRAICKYQGDADALEQAMTTCGFIERDGDELVVVGWEEHNANLWTAWENGKKGGRPKKPTGNPPDNPEETHQKPKGNHPETGRSPDEGDEGDEGEGRKKPAPRNRGCRIPDSFPKSDELKWAADNHPAVNAANEAEKFRDYWAAVPGQKGVKQDWPATWRNWIRRTAENQPKSAAEHNGPLGKVLE